MPYRYHAKFVDQNKKIKFKAKKINKLKKELEVADLKQNRIESAKLLQKIMEILFFIYFKMIKTSKNQKLLLLAFRGLSMYSHLLNIDFYAEIIECFSNFVRNKDYGSNFRVKIIGYFFEMLSNVPDSFIIDYSSFYEAFFEILASVDYADAAVTEAIKKIYSFGFKARLRHVTRENLVLFALALKNICFLHSAELRGALRTEIETLINASGLESALNCQTDGAEPIVVFGASVSQSKRRLAHKCWSSAIFAHDCC